MATVIHVDPRFTRTSAVADLHVPLRAGSDIVFLGGIINYVLAHERYFRDYAPRPSSSCCPAASAGPEAASSRCAGTPRSRAPPISLSIQFGPLDELRERARLRVEDLHVAGQDQARLYLDDPADGIGGGGTFFLLLDEPEMYGLPPDPVVTTRDLPGMWNTSPSPRPGSPPPR